MLLYHGGVKVKYNFNASEEIFGVDVAKGKCYTINLENITFLSQPPQA